MNVIRINKLYLHDFLFYSGFTALLINKFGKIISMTETSPLSSNAIYFLGIALLILSTLLSEFTIWDILLIAYGFSSFVTGFDTLLLSFLVLLIAVRNMDIEKVTAFYAYFQAVILGACTGLYFVLLAAGSSYASLSVIAGRVRCNFLFSHPNNYAVQVVFTVLAYLYVKRKVLPYWMTNVILSVTAVFLYVFPNSKTAVVTVLVYMGCRFLVRYARILWKPFIRVILPATAVIVVIFVFLFYTGHASVISNYIADTFEARFSGAATAFRMYNVNLFGQELEELGETVYVNGEWSIFWLDLAYIRILFTFGIVGTVVFFVPLFKAVGRYIREKNYIILSLLAVAIVYGISEWTAFSITTVFPLLFLSVPLKEKKTVFKVTWR